MDNLDENLTEDEKTDFEFSKLSDEEKEKILYGIIKKFNLSKGQVISYRKNEAVSEVCFEDILQSMEIPIKERDLAYLLGVTKEQYRKFRAGTTNASVLKNIVLSEEEKQGVLEKLITQFDLQKGQLISYKKIDPTIVAFKDIYEEEKSRFTELELGDLLGISKKRMGNIRNKGTTPVLQDRIYPGDRKELLLDIIEQYDLYKGQKVYYKSPKNEDGEYERLCFFEIYEPYKSYFTEMEMNVLLGGTRDTYYKMTIDGLPLILLKQTELLAEERKEYESKIEEFVKQQEGKSINYKQFKELYLQSKKYITQQELTELLGINTRFLAPAQQEIQKQIIKDRNAYEKCKLIKPTLENRWYSIDEIEQICKDNDLEVEKFVKYIMHRRLKYTRDDLYLEALNENGGLWIGHKEMSRDYANLNYQYLHSITYKIASVLTKRYQYYFEQEDLMSAGLEYLITECGDIEENFKNHSDKAIRLMYTRTRKYLNRLIVNTYRYNERIINESFYVAMRKEKEQKKNEEGFFDHLLFKKYDGQSKTEKVAVEAVQKEEERKKENGNVDEKMVNLMKDYLAQGYNKEIAVKNISKLFGMTEDEMIQRVKQYLLDNKTVEKTEKGEYRIKE